MKLSINNKIFTDNTNELEKDTIFVVSKQNEKFKDIAINGGFELLNSSELKKLFRYEFYKNYWSYRYKW
jgi:UDP-N-acetylmuramoyl-L-alanyl-D-glutamate--2,6-diaminopimelate ligase